MVRGRRLIPLSEEDESQNLAVEIDLDDGDAREGQDANGKTLENVEAIERALSSPAVRLQVLALVVAGLLCLGYYFRSRSGVADKDLGNSEDEVVGGLFSRMCGSVAGLFVWISQRYQWQFEVLCGVMETFFCYVGFQLWLVDMDTNSPPRLVYPRKLSKKKGRVAYKPSPGSVAYRAIVWYRTRAFRWLLHFVLLFMAVACHFVFFHLMPPQLKEQMMQAVQKAQQSMKAIQ